MLGFAGRSAALGSVVRSQDERHGEIFLYCPGHRCRCNSHEARECTRSGFVLRQV